MELASILGLGLLVLTMADPPECDDSVSCDSIDASEAMVLDEEGDYGYTSDLEGFTPDRRPIAVISPFNGTYSATDPFGFQSDFETCPDAEDWILGELDDAWDAGFRRFIFNRPGGLPDNTQVPQSMFQHMEDWRKLVYTDAVINWYSTKLAIDADTELGVYIGSNQNNPCDGCMSEESGSGPDGIPGNGDDTYDCSSVNETFSRTLMSAAERDSAELTYQNTKPWIDAGYTAIWFDATSGTDVLDAFYYSEAETILAMQDNPDYAGIKIGGEAVPHTSGAPQSAFVENAAWIALHRFHNNIMGANDSYNPATTEVVCAFMHPAGGGPTPSYDIQTVAEYRDNGFVLASWRNYSYPYLQRVLDELDDIMVGANFGTEIVLDFDADGDKDCDDWDLFHAQWTANQGVLTSGAAAYDGDMDDDGDVDNVDVLAFELLWAGASLPTCP